MDAYRFFYGQITIDKNAPLNHLELDGGNTLYVSAVKYAWCTLNGERKQFGYYTAYPYRYLLQFALHSFDKDLKEEDYELKDDTKTYVLTDYVPLDGFPDDHTFMLCQKNLGEFMADSIAQPEEPAHLIPLKVLYKDREQEFSFPSITTVRGILSNACNVKC